MKLTPALYLPMLLAKRYELPVEDITVFSHFAHELLHM